MTVSRKIFNVSFLLVALMVFTCIFITGVKVSAFTSYLVNDNFEQYNTGTYSALNGSGSDTTWQCSGTLQIMQEGDNKYLSANYPVFLNLQVPKPTGICTFEYKTKTTTLDSYFNYIDIYDTSNRNVIKLSLTNNNIYYNELSADGTKIATVSATDLTSDTWYNIKLVINMDTKKCSVYYGIDKNSLTYLAQRPLNLCGNGSAGSYTFATSIYKISLPATSFYRYYDDFSLVYDDGAYIKTVDVSGPTNIAIPTTDTKYKQYYANTYDNLGNSVSNDTYTWSISPQTTGVSIDSNGLLTVTPNASAGLIDVIATSSIDSTVSGKLSFEIAVSSPNKVRFGALPTMPLRLPFANETVTKVRFYAYAIDLDGTTLPNYGITYSTQPKNLQGVTLTKIDANTVDLSIDSTASPGEFSIVAQVEGIPDIKSLQTVTIEAPIAQTVRIYGNRTITASKTQNVIVNYLATVTDQFGVAFNRQNVDWAITNGYTDANITKGILTVNANAKEGTVEISAITSGISCKKSFVVSYKSPVPAKLDLNTVESATIPSDRTKAVKLYADVYDKDDNLLNGEDVIWSIAGDNFHCNIDENQGILFVYPNSLAGTIKLKATVRSAQMIYKETEITIKQPSDASSNIAKLSLRNQYQAIQLPADGIEHSIKYVTGFIADIQHGEAGINSGSHLFLLNSDTHPKYILMSSTIETDTGLADADSQQGIELLKATYAGKLAVIGFKDNTVVAIYTEQANMPVGFQISSIPNAVYYATDETIAGQQITNTPILNSTLKSGESCLGLQCFKTDSKALSDGTSYNISVISDLSGVAMAVSVFSSPVIAPATTELKAAYLEESRYRDGEIYAELVENDSNTVRHIAPWATVNGEKPLDLYASIDGSYQKVIMYTVDTDGMITDIITKSTTYNGKQYEIVTVNDAHFNNNMVAGYNTTDLTICGNTSTRDMMNYGYYKRVKINELSESTTYDTDIVVDISENRLLYAFSYKLYKKPSPTSKPALVVDCNNNKLLLYIGNDFVIEDLAETFDLTKTCGITNTCQSSDIILNGQLIQYSKNKNGLIDSIRVLAIMNNEVIDTNQMPIDLQNTKSDYIVTADSINSKIDGFTKSASVISMQNGILYTGETQPVAIDQNTPVYYCNVTKFNEGKPYCGFTTIDSLQVGAGSDDQLLVYKYAGQSYCAVIIDVNGDDGVACVDVQMDKSNVIPKTSEDTNYGLLTKVTPILNDAQVTIFTKNGMKTMYLSPCAYSSQINSSPVLVQYQLDSFGDISELHRIGDVEITGVQNTTLKYTATASPSLGGYQISPDTSVMISFNSQYTAKTASAVFINGNSYNISQMILENGIAKIIYLSNTTLGISTSNLPPVVVTNCVVGLDANGNQIYKIGGYYGQTVIAYRTASAFNFYDYKGYGLSRDYIQEGAVIIPAINDFGEIISMQYLYNIKNIAYNGPIFNTNGITSKCGYMRNVEQDIMIFEAPYGYDTVNTKNAFVYNLNTQTGRISFANLNQNSINCVVAYLLVGSTPCVFIISDTDMEGSGDLTSIPLPGSVVAANVEYTRSTPDLPSNISVATACYERDANNNYKQVAIKTQSINRYIALGQTVNVPCFIQIPQNTSKVKAFAFNELTALQPLSEAVTIQKR